MDNSSPDIEAIARLARLAIDPNDVLQYQDAMQRILALVAQMNAVDTAQIAPMGNPHDLGAALRADAVSERDNSAAFLALAPATENNLFLVPKVIE